MQSTNPRVVVPACQAPAVDAYGAVEVGGRVEVVQVETQQQAAQIRFPGVAARSGHDLHDDRLGDGDRALGGDQFRQAEIERAPGRPVVFNPRGHYR